MIASKSCAFMEHLFRICCRQCACDRCMCLRSKCGTCCECQMSESEHVRVVGDSKDLRALPTVQVIQQVAKDLHGKLSEEIQSLQSTKDLELKQMQNLLEVKRLLTEEVRNLRADVHLLRDLNDLRPPPLVRMTNHSPRRALEEELLTPPIMIDALSPPPLAHDLAEPPPLTNILSTHVNAEEESKTLAS